MDEIVKHINDTNASYRDPSAGDAKNTDLFLDNDQYALFEGMGDQITVKYSKSNLAQAILFIASILPRKYDNSSIHKHINYTRTFVEEQLDMLDGFFKIDGQPVESITQKWNVRINVPKKNGEIDNRFYFNGLLQDFEYLDEKSNVRKSKFTIRNYLAGSYSDLHIKKDTDGTFKVWVTNAIHPVDDGKEKGLEELKEIPNSSSLLPRQIIYYGAPGTGKSHAIKVDTKGAHVVRTTFHPDSDYSTFVGAYKPTTKPTYVRDSTGRVVEEHGEKVVEDRIVYEFVPQAFLQAYVDAWRYYAKAGSEEPEKQYLVIEEINRGNCAQIFGDLFQLLDRNDEGYSEYPITADKDMEKYLSDAFHDIAIPNESDLGKLFDDPFIAQKIGLGQVLVLPPNLYVWSTMNTSDQSLFPIDSAFKRRWDWKYIPISQAVDENTKQPMGWSIHVAGKDYDWWSFLQAINEKIGGLTNSQDKKLGYFFCKAKDRKIDAETLVGKVFFFLWNEVLKDFEQEQDFLKDNNGGYLSFDQFYRVNSQGMTEIQEDKVVQLLMNLGVEGTDSLDDIKPIDAQDSSNESDASVLDKYLGFWNKFQTSYEDSGEYKSLFTNPKGLRQNWMNIGGLNRSYYISLSVIYRTNKLRIQVYFHQDRDKIVLEKYIDNLDHVMEAMGQEVTTGAGTKFTYLQLFKEFDMDNDNWEDAFKWYHEECVKFKHLADEIDPK
jgi:hypothetical protein